MIRRGTSYGPELPDGVLDDDGVDQGLMFTSVGANLGRQFEFVQAEWMNDSTFFGGTVGKDPIAGRMTETARLTSRFDRCVGGCNACRVLW
jgi:deferrochelatase/peroxidase EfeB